MLMFRRILTGLALGLALMLAPGVAQAQQAAAPAAQTQATPAADAKTIKIGSVVQLNSGGPKMTVIGLADGIVRGQWFNDTTKSYVVSDFPLVAVKLATDDDDEDEDEDEDED